LLNFSILPSKRHFNILWSNFINLPTIP